MLVGMQHPRRQSSADKIPHSRVEGQHCILEHYDVGKSLGEGSFGKVYEVTEKKTDIKWACKKISKEKAGDPNIKLLEREVSILKRVSHLHIIHLKEVFETPKAVFLIMEFCEDGSLYDVMNKRGPFDESVVKLIIERLASAVGYLHKQDMVHRDLKLQNILLSTNPDDPSDRFYIKVTDFGLSIEKDGVGYDHMMNDYCGTPTYMAPEIIANKMYSEKCDIWSMAVIMYALFTGRLPFESRSESDLFRLIQEANISKCFKENSVWKGVTDKAKQCMCRMFHKDPAYRLTASEVLSNPWITGEEGEYRNVLEILKQFHMDGGGGDEEDCEPHPEGCTPGGESSDPESRNGSAGSGGGETEKAPMPRRSSQADLVKKASTTRTAQRNGLRNSIQLSSSLTKRVSAPHIDRLPGSNSSNSLNGLHSHKPTTASHSTNSNSHKTSTVKKS